MKYETALVALAGVASARELPLFGKMAKREVPQEHSHQAIVAATDAALKLNNPLQIQDAVFALLGNKAAAEGAPNVANLDCLQQIVADQAFTNAKAAGDLNGQINAILFRALERNTGSVGLASVTCNETATNPEIASIQQHQDPASPEASQNADIELAVAKSLASIGADPTLALQSATFPPGQIGDPTAKGNTCDDANDPKGCIFTLNLLTPAVSEADIQAALDPQLAMPVMPELVPMPVREQRPPTSEAAGAAANATAGANAGAAANAGQASSGTVNVQTFTGSLGGPPPPVESTAGAARPFSVNGDTFLNEGAAIQRSCAVQKNACANAANSGQLQGGTAQCDAQEAQCLAAANAKKARRSAASRRSAAARRQAGALDFGSCGSPAIQFAAGLDGRKEESFQNVNTKDFNHGSALNIKVIADFTCQRLQSTCKASDATVQACQQASQAAQAASGQAAADAFNSALGVSA
ncbi:uncharacterized protein THITE_34021 [Thermothielavioides terrestris NRRL 8126]|uniref:Uncharacterized protein n=1 Tax=Thermothielavioides terrestris (strain ATCC 38088 / NRRL 8126) TaxID=578455 RepID=G2QZQ5_THETT|nr:uncharacterized protein THITE_34021 [Thermothielavioides terrestris NRRL 8126]AEO66384.1 hypothetical protein THITE_34021 [Thermothielavioides terrestris NRRL 8126]